MNLVALLLFVVCCVVVVDVLFAFGVVCCYCMLVVAHCELRFVVVVVVFDCVVMWMSCC